MARCRGNCLEVRPFVFVDVRSFSSNHRAAVINAGVKKGRNILITGAGGGVALLAVQLSVARGANVYVTSGSDEKIQRLLSLVIIKGGVNYKHSKGIFHRFVRTSKLNLPHFTQRIGPHCSGEC